MLHASELLRMVAINRFTLLLTDYSMNINLVSFFDDLVHQNLSQTLSSMIDMNIKRNLSRTECNELIKNQDMKNYIG